MVKHLLVLDDSGWKSKPLIQAVKQLGGVPVAEFDESRAAVETASRAEGLNRYEQETELQKYDTAVPYTFREVWTISEFDQLTDRELAQVDIFFIDFKLDAARTGSFGFDVILDGATHEVQLTTGMGVLLYLHEQIVRSDKDSDDKDSNNEDWNNKYWNNRRKARPYDKDNIKPANRASWPAFFAYVDITEPTSKLFATAAAWWFGVPVMPMSNNLATLKDQLNQIGSGGVPFRSPHEEERIRALYEVLTSMDGSRSKYLGEHGREVRRWLAAYPDYLARGRAREALALAGAIDGSKVNVTNQIIPQYQAIYDRMRRFAEAWTQPNDDRWSSKLSDDESGGRQFDQLLRGSAEFWTAEDVDTVFRLWRREKLKRLGPVSPPRDIAAAAKAGGA